MYSFRDKIRLKSPKDETRGCVVGVVEGSAEPVSAHGVEFVDVVFRSVSFSELPFTVTLISEEATDEIGEGADTASRLCLRSE